MTTAAITLDALLTAVESEFANPPEELFPLIECVFYLDTSFLIGPYKSAFESLRNKANGNAAASMREAKQAHEQLCDIIKGSERFYAPPEIVEELTQGKAVFDSLARSHHAHFADITAIRRNEESLIESLRHNFTPLPKASLNAMIKFLSALSNRIYGGTERKPGSKDVALASYAFVHAYNEETPVALISGDVALCSLLTLGAAVLTRESSPYQIDVLRQASAKHALELYVLQGRNGSFTLRSAAGTPLPPEVYAIHDLFGEKTELERALAVHTDELSQVVYHPKGDPANVVNFKNAIKRYARGTEDIDAVNVSWSNSGKILTLTSSRHTPQQLDDIVQRTVVAYNQKNPQKKAVLSLPEYKRQQKAGMEPEEEIAELKATVASLQERNRALGYNLQEYDGRVKRLELEMRAQERLLEETKTERDVLDRRAADLQGIVDEAVAIKSQLAGELKAARASSGTLEKKISTLEEENRGLRTLRTVYPTTSELLSDTKQAYERYKDAKHALEQLHEGKRLADYAVIDPAETAKHEQARQVLQMPDSMFINKDAARAFVAEYEKMRALQEECGQQTAQYVEAREALARYTLEIGAAQEGGKTKLTLPMRTQDTRSSIDNEIITAADAVFGSHVLAEQRIEYQTAEADCTKLKSQLQEALTARDIPIGLKIRTAAYVVTDF